MRLPGLLAFVIPLMFILPTAAHAQGLGTIAGVVRDSTGALIPGVSVEVSSPALIEKVRVAVTNESGQYTKRWGIAEW